MIIWLIPLSATEMIKIYFITVINIVIILTLTTCKIPLLRDWCETLQCCVSGRVLIQQGRFQDLSETNTITCKINVSFSSVKEGRRLLERLLGSSLLPSTYVKTGNKNMKLQWTYM